MAERTLEQVLADARGEAAVLRRAGQEAIAGYVERLCDEVRDAAEPYLQWLSESEAVLRSGRSAAWFRVRWSGWAAQGLARREHGRRYYRELVVPRRADLDRARAEARRAAQESS